MSRTVFLHCGLNKTGSSFLQNVFSRNKSFLLEQKILYPSQQGPLAEEYTAQAGNAAMLSRCVRDLNWGQLVTEIKRLVNEAPEVDKILLSNEGLYHLVCRTRYRQFLEKAFRACGIAEIKYVFVFRDVSSHAISAYGQRCFSSDLSPFREWVQPSHSSLNFKPFLEYYEFWGDLECFLSWVESDRKKIKVIEYKNDMLQRLTDVIGCELESDLTPDVNRSVSTFDLLLSDFLRKRDRNLAVQYMRVSKIFPRNMKSLDIWSKIKFDKMIEAVLETKRVDLRRFMVTCGFNISKKQGHIQSDEAAGITALMVGFCFAFIKVLIALVIKLLGSAVKKLGLGKTLF